MKKFIDLAIEKGVKRFFLLSDSVLDAAKEPTGEGNALVQSCTESLGVEYAILRPTWFMQNLP
jgi:festuclavine dehydrogenase